MKFTFDWQIGAEASFREFVENKIKEDFHNKPFSPFLCHSGDKSVSFFSASPLGTVVEGHISCSCGKYFSIFASSKGGNRVLYSPPIFSN
jgi:hypothetical protein